MTYLILPTAEAHAALELAIRESRAWYGKETETGTTRYCAEPTPDANGKYPFPILDDAAETFIRAYDNGKYADATLTTTVEWPASDE